MSGLAANFANTTAANLQVQAASSISSFTAMSGVAWLYRTTTLVRGGIYNKGLLATSAWPNWTMRGNDGATPIISLSMVTTSASAVGDNTLDVMPLNQWSFQGCSYDATDGPRLWKGGIGSQVVEHSYSSAPTVGSGTQASSDTALTAYIGNNQATGQSFPGLMAFFAWFNRRLTRSQFERLRKATVCTLNPRELHPLFQSYGCCILMPMNFSSGAKAIDYSGYSNHGTPSSDVQMQWGMPNRRI